jgi:hypothetical protein
MATDQVRHIMASMQKPDVTFSGQDKLLLSLIAIWRCPLLRELRHLGGTFFPSSGNAVISCAV